MVIYESVKGILIMPVKKYNSSWETLRYSFDEKDIISNSCSITASCCENQTFSAGGVRPAELSLKLRITAQEVNTFSLYGSKIILWSKCSSIPNDLQASWMLRGEFWVTSASRQKDIYSIKASDAIVWLDNGAYETSAGEQTKADFNKMYEMAGSIFASASYICNEIIGKFVNDIMALTDSGKIFFGTRDDILNEFPENKAYVLLPKDITGGYGCKTPRDLMSFLAQIAGGCVQMIPSTQYSSDDIAEDIAPVMFITPLGYKPTRDITEYDRFFKSLWEHPIKIPYETIKSDGCEIADYDLHVQCTYIKTHDETGWSCASDLAPHAGNVVFDLSDNLFVTGRYYHDMNACSPFQVINPLYGHFARIEKRPFRLNCCPLFKELSQLPKLGQEIEIEESPGVWKKSIITKMKWTFRGGWELSCGGADTRVLSQAAKRSLASHAEEKCRAYANIVSKTAGNSAAAAMEQANAAMENGNIRVTWNQYNVDINNICARLAALESK